MKTMYSSVSRVLVSPVCQVISISKSILLSFLFVAGMFPQQLLAQDVTAGYIPGVFSVSQGGAAEYSIPIEVPPGTASMQPNLSLKYNSNGKNGLLGVGWSLGGLSSISRCQATIAQDGFNGGIHLDSNDRFCMDGSRLVPINGAIGEDGAEYRTEIDSFAKIVSYGRSGSGPAYWKVWTKSGRIIEYGNTKDSIKKAQGNDSVLRWSVNKITDVVGNYLSVSYVEDPANGERRPDRIDYAGNDNAGTVPQLSVRFDYDDRKDVINRYVSGAKITITKRLASIKTYLNEDLAKEYRLAYEYGNASKYSRINDITECNKQYCKPATTFAWQDRDIELNEVAATPDSVAKADEYGPYDDFITADYNADGKTDLLRLNYENLPQVTLRMFLGKGSGEFDILPDKNINRNEWTGGFPRLTGDYNGDGYPDLYGSSYYTGNNHDILFANGDGAFRLEQEHQQIKNRLTDWRYPGDINGDGLADIIAIKEIVGTYDTPTNSLVTFISNGDGTFNEVLYPISIRTDLGVYRWRNYMQLPGLDYPEPLIPGDFNGDGLTDLVAYAGFGGDRFLTLISKGDGTYEEKVQMVNKRYLSMADGDRPRVFPLVQSGDFNGDGIKDILAYERDGSGLLTFFGKGDGSFQEVFEPFGNKNPFSYTLRSYKVNVGDFNGDGLSDIVYMSPYANRTDHVGLISKGDGTYIRYSPLINHGVGIGRWVGDFNGDGQEDLLLDNPQGSNTGYVTMSSDVVHARPDLIISITDGLSDKIQINYRPLTDNSIYTKGSNAVLVDERDVQAPVYVVTQVDSDDGIGGQKSTTYKYGGLKVNIKGRGSLGFAWLEETNQATGIVKRTEYRQDFPYLGKLARTVIRHSDGTVLTVNTTSLADIITHSINNGLDVHFPYISQLTEKKYELNNGALVSTTTTTSTYDDYGNPTQIDVVVAGAPWNENATTVNEYSNDESTWQIGKVTKTTVTYSNPQGKEERKASYAYNGIGLLIQEAIETNDIKLRQQTEYEYDKFGNQTVVTVSGKGVKPRTTRTVYDSQGRYPVSLTNALGHSEDYIYDASFGVMTSLTGPNGLTTSWQYDGFGNKIREDRADGTWTTINLGQCGVADCPNDAPQGTGLYTTTQSTGSPPVTIFYDKKNREIRKLITGFDGLLVYSDTEYNSLGQVSGQSKPYFNGEAVYWTRFAYDDVGRVVSEASPTDGEPDPDPKSGGNTTTYSYNGLTVRETNSLNQTTIQVRDQADNLYKVTDNDGKITTYLHSPTGDLMSTTDPAGNQVTINYNARGWKSSMNDPNMGHWSYEYNAVGELIKQIDAKSQAVTMEYDVLGRMIKRTEPEGVTTWNYDTQANGSPQPYSKGKLTSVSGPGGYTETATYDNKGRAKTATTTISGTAYTISNEYDTSGRVSKVTRPGNFVVENVYDANGYLLAKRSPASQVTDYSKAHLDSLKALAAKSAREALAKAQQYAADAAYYEQWASTYRNEVAQNANVQYLTAEVAALKRHKSYKLFINQSTGELYLKSPDRVMILHAEIDTPIMIPSAVHYKVVTGSNSEWTLQAVDQSTWSTELMPSLADSGEHVFFGDYNGDGKTDYIRKDQSVDNPLYDSALLERLATTATDIKYVSSTLWNLADNALTRANQLIAVVGQVDERLRLAELWTENSDGQDLGAMSDTNSNSITYWQANSRDAEQRLTGFRQGNGLVTLKDYDPASGHLMAIQTGFEFGSNIRELEYHYDAMDNVTSRHDRVQGVDESFVYDNLDRLKKNSVSGSLNGISYSYATDYQYDQTGNILYKSDVGSYSYGTINRANGKAGPAALRSAGSEHSNYQYDDNGNLVSGGGRIFEWTSFNKPKHLQKGSTWIDFTYGPDQARYLKTTSDGETTVYIGKLYEEIKEGTKTTRKHFIYADGELAAIQIKTVENGVIKPDQTRYMHTDALGSVDTITDGFGNIIERMGFDPFGMRRAGNWNRGLPLELAAFTNRGFTGHEHVDEIGIIHMNGRIYDPELGRFLSADPLIQNPYDLQSFNRYSYVLNNPLKYTDPSGYLSMGAWDTREWGGYYREDAEQFSNENLDNTSNYSDLGDGDRDGLYREPITIGDDGNPVIHVTVYSTPPPRIVESHSMNGYGNAVPLEYAKDKWDTWAGNAHNVLDVMGWVPGLGSVTSVIDSAIYASQGDWTTAAFVFAGVLGPAGKVTGRLGRVAKRTPSGGSPALKGDPYHPDSVAARQKEWQKAYGGFDPKAVATELGYGKRISPQKAPFNSHGQPVFSNGKGYITPDVDGHNTTNGWKMFDRKGRRTGTYNTDLSERLKD